MRIWRVLLFSRRRRAELLVLLLMLSLPGCESRDIEEDRRARIPNDARMVFVGPPKGAPNWAFLLGGARRILKSYPAFVLTEVVPEDDTPAAFLAAAGRAVDQKPNAVIAWVKDEDQVRGAFELFTQSRAVLVTIGPEPESEFAMGHVRLDPAQGARLLGESLRAIAGTSKAYMLLHGRGRDDPSTRMYDHFMMPTRLLDRPTLILERSTEGDRRSQGEILAEMLEQFPHTGLVVTLEPSIWLTGEFRSILGPDNRFATLSAVPAVWPALVARKAAGVVGTLDGEIGATAVQLTVRCLAGRRKLEVAPVVEWELVTPDTLTEFADRYHAAAGVNSQDMEARARESSP